MKIENFISYEQPTNYIVHSDQYTKDGQIPVLTAGQSFVLGYTDEEDGIYTGEPVVIFDDFTTSVQYVDFPFKVKSSAMKILKNKQDANIKFCYYLLSWLQKMPPNHKRQWISTTSQIDVNLPPIEWQKKIVQKIESVSNIIKYRKEELKKLDELVSARFVELFGDLKTNSKGWDIKTFDELSYLITDGEHATPKRTTEGIFLLSARNILNHSLQLADVDYIDQEGYDRIAKRIVPKEGDVLISCSGTIGRCCSVPADIKFQMVRSVALIRFKEEIKPVFAEYMITSEYLQEQINSFKTASSQANLFQGKIKALKGFVPPIELQNQFAAFVEQTDKSKVVVSANIVYNIKRIKTEFINYYFNEL